MHPKVELEPLLIGENEIALDGEVFGVVGVDNGELATLEDFKRALSVSEQLEGAER